MWAFALALAARAEDAGAGPLEYGGRVELAPVTGVIFPSRRIALKPAFLYGAELNHFFADLPPAVVIGVYAKVEGCQTAIVESGEAVDVIFGAAGVTLGVGRLGRWLPLVRIGEGFILADGTPGGLDIQGRVAGEVGAGVRYRATSALGLRLEVDGVLHDNLQLGAGSGQLGEAFHVALVAGVSVIR